MSASNISCESVRSTAVASYEYCSAVYRVPLFLRSTVVHRVASHAVLCTTPAQGQFRALHTRHTRCQNNNEQLHSWYTLY
eukprot:3939387-Rhodomonas_salina.1